MKNRMNRILLGMVSIAMAGSLGMPMAHGQEKTEMGGWEQGSAYNKLYVASERDRIKGVVVDIKEIVPLPGMSPGVAMVVRDRDDDVITVHVGPRWFIDPENMGIRKDDAVTVKGVWAEINEEDVFIASKIKKGEYAEYKVRLTKDGTPFWTMSPEERAKEQTSQ